MSLAINGTDGIDFNLDDARIKLGVGDDLQLYHSGSHSLIANTTGKLKISSTANDIDLQTGQVVIRNAAADETLAYFEADGGCGLYYDNSKKLETTSAGGTLTGTLVAKVATTATDTDTTNTGNVTLDFSANQNFVLTLTGNVTLVNPTTEAIGQSGFIAFIQDGTGSRTVSLGTDYETPAAAGLTLTATASATDLVPYLVVASNRILLGTPQLAFA